MVFLDQTKKYSELLSSFKDGGGTEDGGGTVVRRHPYILYVLPLHLEGFTPVGPSESGESQVVD